MRPNSMSCACFKMCDVHLSTRTYLCDSFLFDKPREAEGPINQSPKSHQVVSESHRIELSAGGMLWSNSSWSGQTARRKDAGANVSRPHPPKGAIPVLSRP